MKVLVTGANGFVGSALIRRLVAGGSVEVVAASRRTPLEHLDGATYVRVGELSSSTDWASALAEVDCVVHVAARVHVMDDSCPDPLEEFRRVNVAGTTRLARECVNAGVRRFVYVSSVKVHGEMTLPEEPLTPASPFSPADPYGISKAEAEIQLQAITAESGLELVIVRPPLVYGPGVAANFAALMRWTLRGIPLPFGSITENRRSLVFVENLVDFIAHCLEHPQAANRAFLVSDGDDLSTAALLRQLALALNRSSRLVRVKPRVLDWGLRAIGRSNYSTRLLSSMQVDSSATRSIGWTPPVSVDAGLLRTAEAFVEGWPRDNQPAHKHSESRGE